MTVELTDEAIRAYTTLQPINPIAESLGVSVQRLYQLMSKCGWYRYGPHENRIPRALTPKEQGWLNDIRRRRAAGDTFKDIAEVYGVSRQRVYQRLYGLETKERAYDEYQIKLLRQEAGARQ